MTEKALALRYQDPEELPSVIAKGRGVAAQRILEFAKEHGIPIQEDSALLALLEQTPEQGSIPDESFGIVAELLCFLYEVDKRFKERHPFLENALEKSIDERGENSSLSHNEECSYE